MTAEISKFSSIPRNERLIVALDVPSADEARVALAGFEAVYLPDRPARSDDGAVRVEVLEEGRAVGFLRTGALLVLCFDAGRTTARAGRISRSICRTFSV